jgi:hypothetical protein
MRRRPILLALMCLGVAGSAVTAATARPATRPLPRALPTVTTGSTLPLRTGLQDPLLQGSQANLADSMASDAGVTNLRLIVSWKSVAPANLPQNWDPTDPNSPYYSWGALDAAVSAAQSNGLTPMLNLSSPPSWGYFVQPTASTGGQPKIDALGAFATALARRYPTVHIFEVWNEPNFNLNLSPQDPVYYRSMVNAVADAVHAVNPANLAVAGELAPFKHSPSGADKNSVTSPLDFMSKMLCLSGPTNPTRTCNAVAHFDVWSHHPYSDTGPFGHAKAHGGIELGDLPAMKALLDAAEQLGAISSAKPVQFWVTEFGWSSKPPNHHGAPMGLETRWVAESLYQIWNSGATLATWFLLQDMPATTPFQSGLYFGSPSLINATNKPYLQSFLFPFVAYLKSKGKVLIWGRVGTSDKRDVTIQEKNGSSYKDVATITSNAYGIFTATLSLGAKTKDVLRASAPGSGVSVQFALKPPSNENLHVNPFASHP